MLADVVVRLPKKGECIHIHGFVGCTSSSSVEGRRDGRSPRDSSSLQSRVWCVLTIRSSEQQKSRRSVCRTVELLSSSLSFPSLQGRSIGRGKTRNEGGWGQMAKMTDQEERGVSLLKFSIFSLGKNLRIFCWETLVSVHGWST